MAETISVDAEEYGRLSQRVKRLGREKSALQLALRMMNRVSSAADLEGVIANLLRSVVDSLGGHNAALHYRIDEELHYADVFGATVRLESISDPLVEEAMRTREPVEREHDFADTAMLTEPFSKAYSWAYPLMVGADLVGVLELRSLHVSLREMDPQIRTFFNYAALQVKNGIQSRTRLQRAYDEVAEANERLRLEIGEKTQVEEALRRSRDELEDRVRERTADLAASNRALEEEVGERRRAQEVLEFSSNLVRALFDSSSDYIFVKDRQRRHVLWNRAAAEFAGGPVEQFQGRTDLEIGGLEDADRAVLENGHTVRTSEESHDRAGARHFLDTVKVPLRNAAGEVVAIIGVSRDVTERRQAAEALRESEEAYRSVVTAMAEGVVLQQRDGTITACNQAAERILALPAAEILGKSLANPPQPCIREDGSVFPGEEHPSMVALATGQAQSDVSMGLRRADGSLVWISINVQPIFRSGESVPHAVVTTFIDITERKAAERKLREQAALIDLAHDAIVVLDLGTQKVQFWNRGAERTYGWTAAEAAGKVSQELLGTVFPLPLEELQRAVTEAGEWQGELRHIRNDGREITVASRWSLLRDERGEPVAVLEINRDNTEQKRTQEALETATGALAESQRELAVRHRLANIFLTVPDQEMYVKVHEALLEATGSPIGLVGYIDRDGDAVYPAMSVVWEQCGVSDKTFRYPREQWGGIWGRVLREKKALFCNGPGHTPEGHLEIRRVLSVPLLYGEELLGQITVANKPEDYGKRDVEFLKRIADYLSPVLRARLQRDWQEEARLLAEAELRRLNEELEQRVAARTAELHAANQELEAFTYSVSHDLRAPLRHIAGFSKILVEEHGRRLEPEMVHYLDRIREGTRRMGELVDDLLRLARVGRQDLRCRVTPLKPLVEEVVAESTSGECQGREIEWRVGPLGDAACDPALLRQVFQNLLANAVKFTRPRAQAVIEVGQREIEEDGGGGVGPAIYVRDNGVGFDMKYASRLFGVFQRLHRADEFEGTGVGLATVERIVRKHGGRVWVEAEAGRGAVFYFTLGASAAPPSGDGGGSGAGV